MCRGYCIEMNIDWYVSIYYKTKQYVLLSECILGVFVIDGQSVYCVL